MATASAFMTGLEANARILAPAAKTTFEANAELCSWLLDPLARWAKAAYGDKAFEEAAKGYAMYCLDVWKRQQLYEKAGRYQPEDMPQVLAEVYENEGWMVPYMWAAILIYGFWPSMVNHIAMFRDDFIKAMPVGGKVLELACGHGVLSLLAAETREGIQFKGVDISPPAILVANRLRAVSGHGDRVTFEVGDALQVTTEREHQRYQGIIAAMLAEHLKDPRPLFDVIAQHLSEDGIVFFSTALESAQRDHTFEFHRESEPLKMAEEAGLRVCKLVCDEGNPVPGGRFLPRALAMILRRR
jgi:2-polyprenyl-3-methyl-5-hydroxy-6-metoxy-1,4-benzoquinol methylase